MQNMFATVELALEGEEYDNNILDRKIFSKVTRKNGLFFVFF